MAEDGLTLFLCIGRRQTRQEASQDTTQQRHTTQDKQHSEAHTHKTNNTDTHTHKKQDKKQVQKQHSKSRHKQIVSNTGPARACARGVFRESCMC